MPTQEIGTHRPGERVLPKGQIDIGKRVKDLRKELAKGFTKMEFAEHIELIVEEEDKSDYDGNYPWICDHEHQVVLTWYTDYRGVHDTYTAQANSDAEAWVLDQIRKAFSKDKTVRINDRRGPQETEIYRRNWLEIVGLSG